MPVSGCNELRYRVVFPTWKRTQTFLPTYKRNLSPPKTWTSLHLADRCKRLDALVWSIGWPTLACCPADLQQARNLAYSAHRENLHSSQLIENVIGLLEDTYPGVSAWAPPFLISFVMSVRLMAHSFEKILQINGHTFHDYIKDWEEFRPLTMGATKNAKMKIREPNSHSV